MTKEMYDEALITIANSKICPSWKSKINEREFILGIITPKGILKAIIDTNKYNELESVEINNMDNTISTDEEVVTLLKSINKRG